MLIGTWESFGVTTATASMPSSRTLSACAIVRKSAYTRSGLRASSSPIARLRSGTRENAPATRR